MIKKHLKNLRKKIKKTISSEHLPFLVILVVAIVLVTGLLGVRYYKIVKAERQRAIELQSETQKELEIQKLEGDLQNALKEKSRDETIEELKQQLLDLQNKPVDTKTINNTINVGEKDNTADIVREWSPRVAHIECSWFTTKGILYAKGSGSATLVNFTGLGIRAITSKHIMVYNRTLPKECKVELTDGTVYAVSISESNVSIGQDADWAYVTLPKDNILTNVTKSNVKTCKNVNSGDKLLILGYPKIGYKTGLTVTEGIVSGNDGDYYITSAKIDKGNSGGASILVKDDCYLGIPSASVVGQIESLGRILKASFVIGG